MPGYVFALIAALLPSALWASEIEVDVELALMVDASRSMAPKEIVLQRRGYASALTSDVVLNVVRNSMTGRIAVTYVEWAGEGKTRVILPWTLIDGAESAQFAADILNKQIQYAMRRTSISSAIEFAVKDMTTNGFKGLRRVIDISGDGPNNEGIPVTLARDNAVAKGFIINGLPLLAWEDTNIWAIADLDLYYDACVIGGPGAFSIPVYDMIDFPLAVRRKLVLELAQAPGVNGAPGRRGMTESGYDCLIGEKLRAERRQLNRN